LNPDRHLTQSHLKKPNARACAAHDHLRQPAAPELTFTKELADHGYSIANEGDSGSFVRDKWAGAPPPPTPEQPEGPAPPREAAGLAAWVRVVRMRFKNYNIMVR
jgi:hypothetical protein